jgi:hypothetical protein
MLSWPVSKLIMILEISGYVVFVNTPNTRKTNVRRRIFTKRAAIEASPLT